MYKLICMSFDGEYITEGEYQTEAAALERSDNMGSRWYFYPFHFLTSKSGKTIKNGGAFLNWTKGKRVKTIQKIFKRNSEREDLQNADVIDYLFNLTF